MNIDYQLYLVTDEQTPEEELLPIVEKCGVRWSHCCATSRKTLRRKNFF